MSMQLDVISTTLTDLSIVLDAFYNDFKDYIEINSVIWKFCEKDWERGTMYILGDEEDYEYKYLDNPKTFAQLKYSLTFEQIKRKNPLKFEIEYGYLCEDEQNLIYFQIFDFSDSKCIITDNLKQEIKQLIPDIWIYGVYENSVYIEFQIDESLTTYKIQNCANDFKDYILKTIINRLME